MGQLKKIAALVLMVFVLGIVCPCQPFGTVQASGEDWGKIYHFINSWTKEEDWHAASFDLSWLNSDGWHMAEDNKGVNYELIYTGGNSVEINDKFEIQINAQEHNYGINNLKLVGLSSFKTIESREGFHSFYGIPVPISRGHFFTLQAPSKPGEYICSFEGTSYNDPKVAFGVPITVKRKTKDLTLYFWGGIIVGTIADVAYLSSVGNSVEMGLLILAPVATLFFIGGGAFLGTLTGYIVTPEPKENLTL
jgi:hypothetical protein